MKKTLFNTIALICLAAFATVAFGGDLTAVSHPVAAFGQHGDMLSTAGQHGDMLSTAALIGFGGMTTLAADAPRDYFQGDFHEYPVIATDIIYQGAAIGDNGSGYARPLVAGDPFRGFAELRADNSTGAAGDVYVRSRTRGDIRLAISALAITDVGKDVYASDDATFTLTPGSNTRIGYVHSWEQTGYGMIRFESTSGVMTELTDNTGGSANTTLTALGGITALTDSTGGSSTHDDTLADGLTVGDALVDNSGGEAADGTIAVLVDAGGTAAGAPTTASVANALAELAARCNTLRADLIVQNQNDSDLAQKINELVADMDDAKNNFADLTATVNTLIRRLGN